MDGKERHELAEEQEADLRARLKEFAYGEHERWHDAVITHVGVIEDEDTEQIVNLYRVHMGPEDALGPYDVITATYIHNFWGDATKRGEVADVVVLNGVDGYKAFDPAEEMFPAKASE